MTRNSPDNSRLESFRNAARQVRKASIIAEAQTIRMHTVSGDPGYVDVYVQLLGEEPFRSLALAIRLVYQQGEPAHFESICNILHRLADSEDQQRVAELRRQYQEALRGTSGNVAVDDGAEPTVYTTQEVFDHWLYGIAFHQDANRRDAVRRLESAGARFAWSVQETALQLAGRIMDLDDVIADVLHESRLPRI